MARLGTTNIYGSLSVTGDAALSSVSADTVDSAGAINSAGGYQVGGKLVVSSDGKVFGPVSSTNAHSTFRVFNLNEDSYGIGMKSGQTYGYLNSWATTFTMHKEVEWGWLFRTKDDTDAQGAMSLSTDGKMMLANRLAFNNDQTAYIGSGGTGSLVTNGKLLVAGLITSSAAPLQVNGFQRTGNIYLHSGGNTPNTTRSADVLSNTSTGELTWTREGVGVGTVLTHLNYSTLISGYIKAGDNITFTGSNAFNGTSTYGGAAKFRGSTSTSGRKGLYFGASDESQIFVDSAGSWLHGSAGGGGYIGIRNGVASVYTTDYHTIWHDGNDGSGSGLDADMLRGKTPSTSGSANTIALRDSAGDVHARLLRSTYANQSTIGGAIAFRSNNSTDNYTRYCSSPSAVRTWIGALATGGKAADSDKLDGLNSTDFIRSNNTNGTPIAAYYLKGGTGTTRTKIRLPFKANGQKMVVFTIRVYQNYNATDIQVSGYLYSSPNNWYSPKAVMIAGTTSIGVKMGRDSSGYAYVSLTGSNYRGVAVLDVVGGYTNGNWNSGWVITEDDAADNVALSTTVYPNLTTVGGSISGALSVSGSITGGTITSTGALSASTVTATGGDSTMSALVITNEIRVPDSFGTTDPSIGISHNSSYGINISDSSGIGLLFNGTHRLVAHSGGINVAGYLRFDGNSATYIYRDAAERIAIPAGQFYLQGGTTAFYAYSTATYLGGNSTGDRTYMRKSTIGGDGWSITGAGTASFNGNVTAYASDERLKDVEEEIDGAAALESICSWRKVKYKWNSIAGEHGFNTEKSEIGLLAQDVAKDYPELSPLSPFDIEPDTVPDDPDSETPTAIANPKAGQSISGEDYRTLDYERIVAVQAAAITELNAKIVAERKRNDALEQRLARLEELL